MTRHAGTHARQRWLLAAGVAVAVAAWRAMGTGQPLVNPGGWPQLAAFLGASLKPELSADFVALTWRAAGVTLAFAVCGTSLSLVIGLVGGLLASEAWWEAVGRGAARGSGAVGGRAIGRVRLAASAPWLAIRAALAVPRAIHEVIWGLIFVNILGLDPLVAILAIAIPFGAITAKVFAELLDETPRGPCRALLASGAPPLGAVAYGLLPLALPNLVSYAFYRVECSIRSAAVLGVVGAGGLGHEVLQSFQSLKYREMWTLLYALIALSGLVDAWSALIRHRLGSVTRIRLAVGDLLTVAAAGRPAVGASLAGTSTRRGRDPIMVASFVAVLAGVPLSFWALGVDAAHLWSARSRTMAIGLARDAWPPDLSLPLVGLLLRHSLDTLAVAILAIALAAAGGMLLAFPAARSFSGLTNLFDVRPPPWAPRLTRVAAGLAARLVLLVCRAIPASVWAVLALFVLFPGVLPGAVALGIYTMGVLGRLMAEVVEGLDPGPLRALGALGASPGQTFAYGALPQALPGFISYSLYRWEVCTRESVIVGVVGAAGLGRVLTEQLSSFDYDGITTTLLAFVVLTLLVDLVGAWARQAVRG